MIRILRNSFLVTLLIFLFNGASAQSDVTTQGLTWLKYSPSKKINDGWKLQGEIETRNYFTNFRPHQYLLPRISSHHRLADRWTFTLGYTYFRAIQPEDPSMEVNARLTEHRPHQALTFANIIGGSMLSHRLQVEERWLQKAEGLNEYNFVLRLRLTLADLILPLEVDKQYPDWYVHFSDEIHAQVGDIINEPFQMNWLYGAVRVKLSKAFGLEAGYMNWYQLRNQPGIFFNRHIARLTVMHVL